ncbi:four-helix bundle copper-binding protein (plasmid) [Halorientalis pallida]|uniref:four-helix bundle copper-binding protein n=1 Tax=Halorientalis pallida TaxID=2479928 RepID=UPI003C6F6607
MTAGQFQQTAGAQTGQTYGQSQSATVGTQGGYRQQTTQQSQQLADSISRAVEVCGYCADQCIQESNPGMVECIRLCHDVTEIGETALAMVPRNSRYGQAILQTFQQAVQACAQECGQHDRDHCQECARVLGDTMRTLQQGVGPTQGTGRTQGAGTQSIAQSGGLSQGF